MENIGKMKGSVSLKFYKNGVLFDEKTENNLIVTSGYNSLLRSLMSENYAISKIQIGTNETTPVSSDTTITNPVDLTISSYTIIDNVISILFNIDENTGNGTTFAEFGIIAGTNTLFARKSRKPFLKIADLTIEGVWKINI